MRKIKLLLLATLAVVVSLGVVVQPSGALFYDSQVVQGPYHSGGVGTLRQCAFFEGRITQLTYNTPTRLDVNMGQMFRRSTSCDLDQSIPAGWSKVVFQAQTRGALPGTFVNVGNPIERIQPIAGPAWDVWTQSQALTPGKWYRGVFGFEVLMQGGVRQHLAITGEIYVSSTGF